MILKMTKALERKLADAKSYEDWKAAAIALDDHSGLTKWKQRDQTVRYDFASIRRRLDQLEIFKRANDNHGLLYTLNEGIHGNLGGMGKAALYHQARFGTKQLIVDYTEGVTSSLEHLGKPRVKGVTQTEKEEFFHRADLCYGSSALLLSGAGTYLFFHIGVLKALWQQDLIPQVISGASGGAIVAAVIGTRPAEDLGEVFDSEFLEMESDLRIILGGQSRLRKTIGTEIRSENLEGLIAHLIPDLTFAEAFELSGLQINISIAPAEQHQKSRLLNAITSPNVLVRDAVIASSSVPGLFPAHTLAAKNVAGKRVPYLPTRKWVDGSLSDDLPMKRLSRLYGVNHFIVSQTNPLVLPFVSAEKFDDGIISTISKTGRKTIISWGLAASHLLQRPFSPDSYISKVLNGYISVVAQAYTGDINILPSKRFLNPTKILAIRTNQEIKDLVDDGERATWPMIEKIRIQTQISRTLKKVLRGIMRKKEAQNKPPLKVISK